MTIVQTQRVRSGARVDVRRLRVASVDGRGPAEIALQLEVAARVAEADRLLPAGVRLLVLGASADGDAVDLTLADRRGDPLWMGALPTLVPGADRPSAFVPERGDTPDRNRHTIREALVAAGLQQDPAVWFRWSVTA